MTNWIRLHMSVAATLLIGVSSPAVADPAPAPPSTTTTIHIADLDCPSCAKRVAAKLAEVAGVAKVETDVDAMTATVTPKARAVLSPKALWEAVELAKKTPEKLVGPGGTFTTKPKV